MPSADDLCQTSRAAAVTLIVVNYNGAGCIEPCLQGIRAQIYRDFELVVVDNGSSDGSVSWIEKNHPEVRLIRLSGNAGFCKANNIAIARSNSKFIGLLNNDAVADPDWLFRLVEALDAHPEAGFAASKMLYWDTPKRIDRAGDGYCRSGAGWLRGRGEPSFAYDQKEWIFGACAGAALYRKRMLDDIGYFDEDFFLLYEDVDMSFRAQLRGYKCLYVPEAVVYHMAGRTLGYDSVHSVYYGHRNLEWVYLQNMPGPLLLLTLPMHVLYGFLSLAFFAFKGKAGPFLKGKRDALLKLKSALKKRNRTQRAKTVSNAYLWRLMEKERFHRRLSNRFSQKTGEAHDGSIKPH